MVKAKRIMGIAMASLMTASMIAGCGGSSTTSGETTEPADTASSETASETTETTSDSETQAETSTDGASGSDITATITVGGWPSGDDAFKAAEAGFHEMYPNITVEYVFTDTTSHHQNLQTALAAGSGAPDVAMVEGAYVAQYRNSTALADLNQFGAADLADDFVSFKWDQCKSDDGSAFRLIPWDVGPATAFYRTDVFEAAGLPTDPAEVEEYMSTWDGVLKAAEAVGNLSDNNWFMADGSYLYQLLFQNRDYYDEDLNLKLERDGDIDCLNTIIKMREEGLDMNVDMWSTEAYAAYADGSIAYVPNGCWFGGFLKTDIDPDGAGHWAVCNLPAGIGEKNWGGSFLVIPEQSQNKEAAWAFVSYMLATEKGQNDMFEAVDYFPGYMPAYESDIYDAGDEYFGGEQTRKLWAEIATKLEPVYTTQMDTTAEGQIFTSVNQGLQEGLDAEGIRDLLATNIETATAEIKQQQIQTLKDAGVWNGN